MASALYDLGREAFLGDASGQINWTNDSIKAALVSSSYAPSLSSDQYYSTIAAKVVMSSSALSSKTTTAGVANAGNVTFSAVPANSVVNYIAIFKDTGVAATSPLIALIDTATGIPVTTNGGDIIVQWDSGTNKIFKL